MKNFLVLLFALVLIFTLAACATSDEPFEGLQDDISAIADYASPAEEEPSEEEDTSPADEESSNSEELSDPDESDLPESSPTPTEDDSEDTDNDFDDVPDDFNFTHGFVIDHRVNADAFGFVENFLPGEAYVIISYVSVGTLPWSGISFLDENDQWWVFAILQNQADEGDAYLLLPLVAYG